MRTSRRILGAAVAAATAAVVVPSFTSAPAEAARFTGGNLVVYRVGTPGGTLTNAAAAVSLVELSPTGTAVGTVALPTAAGAAGQALTSAGQSRSEGLLSTSGDGRFLTLTGYAAAPGTTASEGRSLTATDPAATPRVVGVVDANGTVDTSTVLGADAPQIIRSAASADGDRLFAAGGDGGLLSTSLGSSSATRVSGTDTTNLTALSVQGDQLFAGGVLADRIATVGSGVPTGSATSTALPGLPSGLLTWGYALVDVTSADFAGTGLDTLYVANASLRGGTVDKYRWSGSTWTLAGVTDVPEASGLVADVNGADVSIAVTTPSQVLLLTDKSASGTTFAPGAPTTLATAPAGTEFRGVALAPEAPAGPSLFVRSPLTGSTLDLAGDAITVTAYTGTTDVDKVTARIGDSVATATRSGDLWTATIPTAGLSAGTEDLVVSATGADGTTTRTREVVLSGESPALGKGTYAPADDLVAAQGSWKSYKSKASPTKKGLQSAKKGDSLRFTADGKTLVLTLDGGPTSGLVQVVVDGKKKTVDSYAAAAGPVTATVKLGGGRHDVVLTVLGKKSTASSGTTVRVAALQVK